MVRLRQQNSSFLLLEASHIKRKIDGNSYLINRDLRSIYEETTTFSGTKKIRNRSLDYSFGNIGSFPILRCNR